MTMTKETVKRIERVISLAKQTEFMAANMGDRVRISSRFYRCENSRSGNLALRWAILLRRQARLAELYAELSGAIREA